jgi:hypothetical protein
MVLLSNFGWASATNAGRAFRRSGKVDAPWDNLLNVKSTKVAITPIDKDILNICDGKHEAHFLGRSGDASYILLVLPSSDRNKSDETWQLVRVPDGEYKISTMKSAPPCEGPSTQPLPTKRQESP